MGVQFESHYKPEAYAAYPGSRVNQTFPVPANIDHIDGVSLPLTRISGSGNFTIYIFACNPDGTPSNTILAQQSFDVPTPTDIQTSTASSNYWNSSTNQPQYWFNCDFATPAVVTPGSQVNVAYATPSGLVISWWRTNNANYGQGAAYVNGGSVPYDFCFQARGFLGQAPSVQTDVLQQPYDTQFAAYGTVTSDNYGAITRRGFVYAPYTSNPTIGDGVYDSGGTVGAYVNWITGLTPATLYYCRAFAQNQYGISYGAVLSIATIAYPPTVSTDYISDVTQTTFLPHGTVSATGGSPVTRRGFVMSAMTSNPTMGDQIIDVSGTTGAYAITIGSLTPGVTYYIRAFAQNAYGTNYGAVLSAYTPVYVPAVTTNDPQGILENQFTAYGNATWDGGAAITIKGFVWSKTTSAPDLSNADYDITGGAGTGSYNKAIGGLIGGTTYYYRAFAQNSQGTSYGAIKSLITAINVPTVYTSSLGTITEGNATINANVTDQHGGVIIQRGICWNLTGNPTTADNIVASGNNGLGQFTVILSGLSPNTTYYIKAFAINSAGAGYGVELNFTTKFIVNEYALLTGGNQIIKYRFDLYRGGNKVAELVEMQDIAYSFYRNEYKTCIFHHNGNKQAAIVRDNLIEGSELRIFRQGYYDTELRQVWAGELQVPVKTINDKNEKAYEITCKNWGDVFFRKRYPTITYGSDIEESAIAWGIINESQTNTKSGAFTADQVSMGITQGYLEVTGNNRTRDIQTSEILKELQQLANLLDTGINPQRVRGFRLSPYLTDPSYKVFSYKGTGYSQDRHIVYTNPLISSLKDYVSLESFDTRVATTGGTGTTIQYANATDQSVLNFYKMREEYVSRTNITTNTALADAASDYLSKSLELPHVCEVTLRENDQFTGLYNEGDIIHIKYVDDDGFIDLDYEPFVVLGIDIKYDSTGKETTNLLLAQSIPTDDGATLYTTRGISRLISKVNNAKDRLTYLEKK